MKADAALPLLQEAYPQFKWTVVTENRIAGRAKKMSAGMERFPQSDDWECILRLGPVTGAGEMPTPVGAVREAVQELSRAVAALQRDMAVVFPLAAKKERNAHT